MVAVLLSSVAQHPASASRLLKETDVTDVEDEEMQTIDEPVSTMATFSSWPESLLSSYLSNDQLAAWSQDYISRCGKIARRFSIGKSVKGADLWVIEVAANPGKVEAKPNFKYVSARLAMYCGTVAHLQLWHTHNIATESQYFAVACKYCTQGCPMGLLPAFGCADSAHRGVVTLPASCIAGGQHAWG